MGDFRSKLQVTLLGARYDKMDVQKGVKISHFSCAKLHWICFGDFHVDIGQLFTQTFRSHCQWWQDGCLKKRFRYPFSDANNGLEGKKLQFGQLYVFENKKMNAILNIKVYWAISHGVWNSSVWYLSSWEFFWLFYVQSRLKSGYTWTDTCFTFTYDMRCM